MGEKKNWFVDLWKRFVLCLFKDKNTPILVHKQQDNEERTIYGQGLNTV